MLAVAVVCAGAAGAYRLSGVLDRPLPTDVSDVALGRVDVAPRAMARGDRPGRVRGVSADGPTLASLAELPSGSAVPTAASAVSTLELTGLQAAFEEVARRVAPSVVAVSVASRSAGEDHTVRPDDLTGARLAELLQRTTRTVGTGFIIDAEGLILTNEHVVAEADQIWCTTDGGRVLPAFVVGSDPRFDLAVLRVPAVVPLTPVRFAVASGDGEGGELRVERQDGTAARQDGAEAAVRRGQWVITLGNPYGLAVEGRLAVSVGVVSAVGRALPRLSSRENRVYRDLIQTTAEINPGNSGGPLFDLEGRVVGINTAVVLPQRNSHGISFAMPVTRQLLRRVEMLKRGQDVPSVHVGVRVVEPTPAQRRTAGLEREVGVLVEAVERAGETGLRTGDVIVQVDGVEVAGMDAFAAAVAGLKPDVPVQMKVMRAGRPVTVLLTPQRRVMPSPPVTSSSQRYRWRGMLLGPIPEPWAFPGLRPTHGLMVLASDPGVPGALPAGTVVQAVGGRPVRSVSDLQSVLATTPPERWRLTVFSPSSQALAGDAP